MKRSFFVLMAVFVVGTLLTGCGKKVAKINLQMVGEWRHFNEQNGYEEYHIYGDSRDKSATFENGILVEELTGKKWFMQRGDYLTYGRKSPFIQYKSNRVIEIYPTVATVTIVDNYDTIPAGSTYMLISGRYYLKVK